MDPGGTTLDKVARDGHGVVGVHVNLGPVPTAQAHDLATEQIDGGKQDHRAPP